MIRIASGQGFWGDDLEAPVRQVEGGPVDYLVLDYLAEVTLSIMSRQRAKNPTSGYATDFLTDVGGLLPEILQKEIKVITNAGEAIENGIIVIQSGRITAVGKDIEYPWNAEVKEFPNSVAFPGFVEAHSNQGMDRANETPDVAPFLNVPFLYIRTLGGILLFWWQVGFPPARPLRS